MTSTATTIRVRIGNAVLSYESDAAGLGEFLACGGRVGSFHAAQTDARTALAQPGVKAVEAWAYLDDSGLAYRVRFERGGDVWTVLAAAVFGPIVHTLDGGVFDGNGGQS